jgi:beclin 1
MDKGKIKENNSGVFYSIKLQFNSEDSWTKACRYMLTNLKWGLAWITSLHESEQQQLQQQQQQQQTG